MKSVLISIQPKWCELIASGKKTIEVRKTRPKIDTPFKVYIYCTKAKEYFSTGGGVYAANDELYRLPTGEIKFGDSFELVADWSGQYSGDNLLNGKVIGEFVCDKINCLDEGDLLFGLDEISDSQIEEYSCLSLDELFTYKGNKEFIYGWHISSLVIYDKPKELSKIKKRCYSGCETCKYKSWDYDLGGGKDIICTVSNKKPITRPPQSWCYVENDFKE